MSTPGPNDLWGSFLLQEPQAPALLNSAPDGSVLRLSLRVKPKDKASSGQRGFSSLSPSESAAHCPPLASHMGGSLSSLPSPLPSLSLPVLPSEVIVHGLGLGSVPFHSKMRWASKVKEDVNRGRVESGGFRPDPLA